MRKSGAIILGKTNTPEFGFSEGSTDNRLGDACRNPWDTTRSTGASSGGNGAALAAGLSPLTTGSDGGGSIRTPSSYCGTYGIKPTLGRVPDFGGVARPAPNPLSQPGPMTRSVKDAAMLLQALAGHDDRDPITLREQPADYVAALDRGIEGMRVAWSPDLGHAAVEPEVVKITAEAARAFEELGATVEEPDIVLEPHKFHPLVLAYCDVAYGFLLEERREELTDSMREWLEAADDVTGADCARSLRYQDELRSQVASLMETYDLLLCPVTPVPAFPLGEPPEEIGGRKVDGVVGLNPFNVFFNLTQQPAASVPCGFTSEGLPVGLHVVGRWGDEVSVLRASAAFEQMRPWADRLPPVS